MAELREQALQHALEDLASLAELEKRAEAVVVVKSALAELEKDRERLDWLEFMANNTDRVGNGLAIQPLYNRSKEIHFTLVPLGDQDMEAEDMCYESTLREAIDAAMKGNSTVEP